MRVFYAERQAYAVSEKPSRWEREGSRSGMIEVRRGLRCPPESLWDLSADQDSPPLRLSPRLRSGLRQNRRLCLSKGRRERAGTAEFTMVECHPALTHSTSGPILRPLLTNGRPFARSAACTRYLSKTDLHLCWSASASH